jgi:Na(+)-translocating NADH:ubiquinone oxidoreductase A subunit
MHTLPPRRLPCWGVNFTSPGGGVIKAINRGAKRVLNSVVIQLDAQEEAVSFPAYSPEQLSALDADTIRQQLLDSGQWIAFRTRPYSKVPKADSTPASIFVTAIDTYAMAADPAIILAEQAEAFQHGLTLIAKLAPNVFVNHKADVAIPKATASNIRYHEWSGVHPAGLPGTHIHFLDPVSEHKTVWHIGYQDVIAITVPANNLILNVFLKDSALLQGVDLRFLGLISYIAVIAAIVQVLEMVLDKFVPSLYQALGVFLPLITVGLMSLGFMSFSGIQL